MAAGKLAAAALSGRIADPKYTLERVGAGAGMLSRIIAWGNVQRREAQTRQVLGTVHHQWLKGKWDMQKVLERCTEDYLKALTAISAGNTSALRSLVTEAMGAQIRKGILEGIAETGARQGVKIVQKLNKAEVVQARVINNSAAKSMSRLQAPQPEYLQLTLQHRTMQLPIASVPTADELKLARKASPPSEDDVLGEWVPVYDREAAYVYWYNTATKARTWEAPRTSLLVPRKPFRIETAGHIREPAADLALAAGSEVPYMVVTHNVVWERQMGEGASDAWRIAYM